MKLTDCIVEHILNNLGMLQPKQNSIFSSQLLIKQKLTFEEENIEQSYNIYACENTINQSKLSIAASQIKKDEHQELLAIIMLEGSPIYGCYLVIDHDAISESKIVFQIKDHIWMDTNIFIQASFLAGMEQLKDLTSSFVACSVPDLMYQHLLSFIKYLDQDEGQKD